MRIVLSKSRWEKIGQDAGWRDIQPLLNYKTEFADLVKSKLIDIIMEEEAVSEKAFSAVDAIAARASEIIKRTEVTNVIEEGKAKNSRPSMCAEIIFDKILKKSGKSQSTST